MENEIWIIFGKVKLHSISTRPWISNKFYICNRVRISNVSVDIIQANRYLHKTVLESMDLMESTIQTV